MDSYAELCGFMDAKLPGNLMRKRSFVSWKTWRRHWCTVRKLGLGLGAEVQLERGLTIDGLNAYRNTIKIPSDSVICRTESRTKSFAFGIFPAKERKPLLYLSGMSESETQRWMANIRELLKPRRYRFVEGTFNISMVDNTHSRSSGLTGLHGDLVASRCGIFIKDVHTGNIIEHLEWSEMNQFNLSTIGHPDDVKRICVIHTTKSFRGGIGELNIFCLNASQLLQSLVKQGREPRQHSNKIEIIRPLSLSEGDLRFTNDNELGNLTINSKVVSSLANAELLLLKPRLEREGKFVFNEISDSGKTFRKINEDTIDYYVRAVDNVYDTEPANLSNISASLEELEEPLHKRVSNLSVASGIYEEIVETNYDNKLSMDSLHVYENLSDIKFNYYNKSRIPPPLPPRIRCGSDSSKSGIFSDDELHHEDNFKSSTSSDTTGSPQQKILMPINTTSEHSDYVPMSPRPKDIVVEQEKKQIVSNEEDIYMVMR
ncbi:uncharacterized protein LOC103573512 [Microplitis demolitor]|uniref:uncharacterized protein LOC103573512 n=1 Tax=Microplitis demolitor TaxID=69319 RepID=UPI0004CDC25D|nr:uncharacterized protein LOC103573512 [Microplitis demolitor]XP_008550874.1 uncharacterized protein LOC103573512 [Microplitis demolitor]XP_053598969.1 uncharacterized protein LOC103573512 [Microplitis demolitor]XP_053598970.1 uncharacterized protein LOC103573512 [Microplitis demolitor]